MKNRNITALFRCAVLCLALAGLSSCGEETFSRSAGNLPDEDNMTNVGGALIRTRSAERNPIFRTFEGKDAVDAVRYQLTQPATADVTITIAADESLVEAYNLAHKSELAFFPSDKVTISGNGKLTVTKGKKLSGDLEISVSREGVEKGLYLLPVRATVESTTLKPAEKDQIIYYRVAVAEVVPESELDAYDFKVVAYVNTEEMSPLVATGYQMWVFDLMNETETTKTWIDIEILRVSTIKLDKISGRAMLELGRDVQYVLNNTDKYLMPLEKSNRKILLGIHGGGTGLGFCNLSDAQIADFIYQLKYVVENYGLDGVNFIDIEAGYGKEGVSAIIPASYAKLIKAAREALGDEKLITVACDEASTDYLAEAQGGIEAGAYIDYAWPSIFDKVVDPYAEGSELKPIAGLEQSKWGSSLIPAHDTGWMGSELKDALKTELRKLYFEHPESANIFAFWDLPAARAGIERGAAESFTILAEAMLDENGEYPEDERGLLLYDAIQAPGTVGYGKFLKDW